MSLRVVLYAEGGLDLGGDEYVRRAPGSPIPEPALGAAHLLAQRCLVASRRLPPQAIRFEEPLRDSRGNVARGSALYTPDRLRQLLSWPANERRPQLAIVLVDADGDSQRLVTLLEATSSIPVQRVIGVAVQEFESWLIADQDAVNQVFSGGLPMSPSPEALERREAKTLLESWILARKGEAQRASSRRSLVNLCDLEEVQRRCPSFEAFRKALTSA